MPDPSRVPAQVLFRSVNKLLMDTATSEYLFCADFFGEDAVFHELFGPTLAAVEAHLSSTVQVCASLPAERGACSDAAHSGQKQVPSHTCLLSMV